MWKQKESADDYVTSHTKTPKLRETPKEFQPRKPVMTLPDICDLGGSISLGRSMCRDLAEAEMSCSNSQR